MVGLVFALFGEASGWSFRAAAATLIVESVKIDPSEEQDYYSGTVNDPGKYLSWKWL